MLMLIGLLANTEHYKLLYRRFKKGNENNNTALNNCLVANGGVSSFQSSYQ